MVAKAKKMGMPAIGLTDHGTVAGIMSFLRECRAQGIKPILGMEAYQCRNHFCHDKEGQPDGRRGNRHLNVIAKNYKGYQNLCALSQKASLEGMYYDPRIDLELLWQHREGLIVTSACLSNIVNWHLSQDRYDAAKNAAGLFQDIFGEDYYLEMMFHGIDSEAKILPDIQKLGKDLNIKTIVTNDCFVAGTMVKTEQGVIPIENINVGDFVVTHTNKLQRVEFVNQRLAEETFIVKTNLGTIAFEATSNHPVFVTKKIGKRFLEPQWKSVCELTSKDYLVLHKCHEWNCSNGYAWIDIPSIIDQKYNRHIIKKHYNTYQGFDGRRGVVKIPTRLKLDKELLFILGRYVAEGWIDVNSNQVGFAANDTELEIQDRVENYFSRFGIACYRPRNGKDCKLVFSSVVFKELLSRLCGHGASNKHLPMIRGDYNGFSKKQMIEILKGYVGGDGHIATKLNRGSVICATTSKLLAYQISDVITSLGFMSLPTVRYYSKTSHKNPNAKPENWSPLYVLHMSETDIERFCGLISHERKCNNRSSLSRRKFIDIGKYYAVKVREIKKCDQQQIVYNLQVAGDESYVANSYIVHNCHYEKKEDAEYHEYVMCMSSKRSIKDPKRLKFPFDEFYLKSEEEMLKVFGHCRQSMQNTLEIAEKCDYSDIIFVEEGGTMKLPHFDIPDPYSDPFTYLKDLAWQGLKREKLHRSEEHKQRLKRELDDIKLIWDTKRYDFSTYFLVVEDMMRFARENGIASGIRGSGYGSLLLKCLGITEGVDPLEQDLLWERFLGFDDAYFISESDFGIGDAVETAEKDAIDETDPSDVMFERYV